MSKLAMIVTAAAVVFAISVHSAPPPPRHLLLVHAAAAPLAYARERYACELAPEADAVVVAGQDAEMYAMTTEMKTLCPAQAHKVRILHFGANNTAEHLQCALKWLAQRHGGLPMLGPLRRITSITHKFALPRTRETAAALAADGAVRPWLDHVEWRHLGVDDPPDAAWRRLAEKDIDLPQLQDDMYRAQHGPCALRRLTDCVEEL